MRWYNGNIYRKCFFPLSDDSMVRWFVFLPGCCLLLLGSLVHATSAETLAERDTHLLERYLQSLAAGTPADAALVDRLAEMSFADLQRVMRAYVELPNDAEPHTHRAFQGLLERASRTALAPWPLILLYSPKFAEYLSKVPEKDSLARKLFAQLLSGPASRQAAELAVRLCAIPSLELLASDNEAQRRELFDAWNHRLAHRKESRPLAELEPRLKAIAEKFTIQLPADLLEVHLRFLASWPVLQTDYERALNACLQSQQVEQVLAGLAAQKYAPASLATNADLVIQWQGQPEVQQAALRNYAFDAKHDRSATLRKLWNALPPEATKARYNCLYAMGVHPQGNDAIALVAVQTDAFDYIDVAMPILAEGNRANAEAAVRHVLTRTSRGYEEALRLARSMKLTGFADEALAIAGDAQRDQVVRQAALYYLQLAPGNVRRELLPLLTMRNGDLRLAAIQMFAEPAGLTAADKNEIGPALIRLAQNDPSRGHRQEAIFALGRWEETLAEPFFRQLLAENPAVTIVDGHYNDQRYWQYRLRLVALLGLARLNNEAAERELLALHASGGPTERMDVLLVYMELGRAPKEAFEDLSADEPKLVATAAALIAEYGTAEQKRAMQTKFRDEPLWQAFRRSGADDHNILSTVGLGEEPTP
jgi:hypothetical protein